LGVKFPGFIYAISSSDKSFLGYVLLNQAAGGWVVGLLVSPVGITRAILQKQPKILYQSCVFNVLILFYYYVAGNKRADFGSFDW